MLPEIPASLALPTLTVQDVISMDTLDNTNWDVVISGTGLKQSLLALSLSRSGKKVLHLDRNAYYGSNDAALSLSETEAWAAEHADTTISSTYSHAIVKRSDGGDLGPSRSYSLALAPQLIFARANLIPALVSSKVHGQLEFQAVGSWFVVNDGALSKVPNGREDIFQDSSLSLKDKRALMKFIRHINDPEAFASLSDEAKRTSVPSYLQANFGIPAAAHAPIMALTLSAAAPASTTVSAALPRVVRHLQSIGIFGSGFGALIPKWGGLAEIAQVACRAGAVGGGVYVLNRAVDSIEASKSIAIRLSDGEGVKTSWLVGSADELELEPKFTSTWTRGLYIVSSTLSQLFPPTSEGGVVPVGAVVMVSAADDEPPVYVFAHSSDSGECPAGKCVLYAAVALAYDAGASRLQSAVHTLLSSLSATPDIISWSMQLQHNTITSHTPSPSENVIVVNDSGFDLALEDNVLDEMKSIWHKITNEDPADFLEFDAREGADDDDGYDNDA